MKKIMLMAALLVGVTTFAQEREMKRNEMPTEERVEKRVEMLTKQLDLTKEQQEKMTVLLEKQAEIMKIEREKAKADRMAKNEMFQKEINAILTPEQIKTLEAKKEKMKESHPRKQKMDRQNR